MIDHGNTVKSLRKKRRLSRDPCRRVSVILIKDYWSAIDCAPSRARSSIALPWIVGSVTKDAAGKEFHWGILCRLDMVWALWGLSISRPKCPGPKLKPTAPPVVLGDCPRRPSINNSFVGRLLRETYSRDPGQRMDEGGRSKQEP